MATSKKGNTNPVAIIITLIIFIVTMRVIRNANKSEDEPKVKTRGYQIQFADDFKKGLYSQDDLGISIVIGVDTSGSMGETLGRAQEAKYIIASEAMTEIVTFLEEIYRTQFKKQNLKLKMAMLTFSSDVEVLYPLTEMNSGEFSRLVSMVKNPNTFRPYGETAIGMTMEKGVEILSQSGTIFRSLIIVSDGENTQGVKPEIVMRALVENKNNKNSEDYPITTDTILTSFIGFDLDAAVFQDLNEMGARVTSAFSRDELKDSLRNIFVADITKLEAGN